MEWVPWAIGLVVIGTLVFGGNMIWEESKKRKRIPTEGTVTSITRQTKLAPTYRAFEVSQSYTEVTMNFEFDVGGHRWTGHKTVRGDLAHKKKGDGIRVYYLPESPGRDQMLEP